MTDIFSVINERIDDVPLIIEICKQMKLDDLIEECLPTHGLQQGLNNGKLTVGWLAYMISQGDHRLNSVRDWAGKIPSALSSMLGSPIRDVEFSDDRLGNLLDRFSEDQSWEEIENKLWKNVVEIYELPLDEIRLDGTTVCGHHEVTEDGIMQYGASKDHRPDLPQLKIMAASTDPGIIIRWHVASGEQNDDILYMPLIERVRKVICLPNRLYVGDCKMSSYFIRGSVHSNGDYYLAPLQLGTEKIRKYFNDLVDAIVTGSQCAELIYNSNNEYIVAGYEVLRKQETILNDQKIEWEERVFVYRSKSFAESEINKLEKRISKAEKAIIDLTPPLKRGKKQIKDEIIFQKKLQDVIEKHQVQGLFEIKFKKEENKGSERFLITHVVRKEVDIERLKQKCGWRLMATNSPLQRLSFMKAILLYRGQSTLENNYRALKSHLGISPLHVRKEGRIKGLSRLLSIALRLIMLIQFRIRESLASSGDVIKGLEKGKPNSTTNKPTTQSILKRFVREQVTISKITLDKRSHYHITSLHEELLKILKHLKVPPEIYQVEKYVPCLT